MSIGCSYHWASDSLVRTCSEESHIAKDPWFGIDGTFVGSGDPQTKHEKRVFVAWMCFYDSCVSFCWSISDMHRPAQIIMMVVNVFRPFISPIRMKIITQHKHRIVAIWCYSKVARSTIRWFICNWWDIFLSVMTLNASLFNRSPIATSNLLVSKYRREDAGNQRIRVFY